MKKLFASFCLALIPLCLLAQPLNVMTFNIRYDTPADSANAWPFRKDKAASQIHFHEAHLVGLQEALYGQITDLQDRLPLFRYTGGGRDDGKLKGEFSAILYDTSRLQLLRSQTFWLSEQPNVPGSKSWDAAFPRIVTWAQFKDRKTKKTFFAFNTHFDHMGRIARAESARLLLKKIGEIAGPSPVVVTGDFNSRPGDEPIQTLIDSASPVRLTDAKLISAQPHYGPSGTFNAFKNKEQDNQPIDYIFVKNVFKVIKHATLSQTWEGLFSSDHFPVYAVITLK